jgi:hypothetical protein
MDNTIIIMMDNDECYDPLLLKFIIDYIIIPYKYAKQSLLNNDYLLYINKNIMENIFNKIINKYELNINYYNDFIIYLEHIYDMSILDVNIYNCYDIVIKLLPLLPSNILYEYMYNIFNINPIIWKYIINPITLNKYLNINKTFKTKCDEIRNENMLNNNWYAPDNIINKHPSIFALIIIAKHIDLLKYTYDIDILTKYEINIDLINQNDYKINDSNINVTFIDIIKHNINEYNNIIKIIYLNWSFNKEIDFQNTNKTLFVNNISNDICILYKMWWLCSATYNETEHKIYNRNVTNKHEIHICRSCDNKYDKNIDICPYNIYKKNGCNTHCMVNEMRFILNDNMTIRKFYNPIIDNMFDITNHVCKTFLCKSEQYFIKFNILLNELIIDKEDYDFITNSNDIIKFIQTTKNDINPCNIIGCCCKEKTYSLTYVSLPKNDNEFNKLMNLYKLSENNNDVIINKNIINKYIKHDDYCYTCASLIMAYQLKNSKKNSNISSFDLYNYMIMANYHIKGLGCIKIHKMLYNNKTHEKRNIKIEFKLYDILDDKIILNDSISHIKKISRKCKCVKCLTD